MPKAANTSKRISAATAISSELKSAADPAKARILARFFKTGPGEYGEGDRFYGVVVPKIRGIVRTHRNAPRRDVCRLLRSKIHEERLAALLLLVAQYGNGADPQRQEIFDLYLASTAHINNWDLVDLTAPHIVGAHLDGKDTSVLTRLAQSKNLWERRIAMLSTFYFIRRGDCRETFRIAELLLRDPHDLIHKAVGWMLREAGKCCSLKDECRFLDAHASEMPRTMLRYAIERMPERLRIHYLRSRRGTKESE